MSVILFSLICLGKSSLVNWYIEDNVQRTGVAIETQGNAIWNRGQSYLLEFSGVSIITSGKRRESLMVILRTASKKSIKIDFYKLICRVQLQCIYFLIFVLQEIFLVCEDFVFFSPSHRKHFYRSYELFNNRDLIVKTKEISSRFIYRHTRACRWCHGVPI